MKKKARVSYSSKIGKRNKRRQTFKLAILFILPFVFGAGLIFALRLNVFQIQNVVVEGAVSLNEEQIKLLATDFISGAYLGLVPRTNILLADTNELEQSIKNNFGKVDNVKISRSADGNLKIKIKEKMARAIWCKDTDCFLVDGDGFVYARALESEKSQKVVFAGSLSGDPIGRQLVLRSEMEGYFGLIDRLQTAGIETRVVMLESGDKSVLQTSLCDIVVLPGGAGEKETADNILLLIESELQKNNSVKFEYIDARFNNKMFYKTI